MVKGADRLHRKMQSVPQYIIRELSSQMEKEAGVLVREMGALNPLPGVIEVGWAWGKDVPKGALRIASFRGAKYAKLTITIYATAKTEEYPNGFPAIARWFEFGTAERAQKETGRETGRVTAEPYFYPVFRANRARIRSNLSRALRRAMKKATKKIL